MAFGDNVVFGNVRNTAPRRTPTNYGGGVSIYDPTGTFTQATQGGINLQTGQPLDAYASGYPRVGGMTMQPQTQQPVDTRTATVAPSTSYTPPAGISNSDRFFSGPSSIASRVVSITPNTSGQSYGSNSGAISPAILKSIMDSFNASKAANEGRYNAAQGEVAKLGKVREGEIAGQYKQDAARMEQQAISRGLGNSSIREALLGGARQRQNEALTGLREAQAKTNIDLLQSREDTNVNPMALIQLIQQAAQYGGGNQLASIAKAMGLA